MNSLLIQPADIIFVTHPKSRTVQNVAFASNQSTIIECNHLPKEEPRYYWLQKYPNLEVWRCNVWDQEQKEMLGKALHFETHYPNFNLLQKLSMLLDYALTNMFRKNIFFFRRPLFDQNLVLGTWLYIQEAKQILDYEIDELEPEELFQFVRKSKDWNIVHKESPENQK
ncbi:MAG: hypothetical protein ABEK17_00010 [Candidatus Aenigmatarchaeota archaeon]